MKRILLFFTVVLFSCGLLAQVKIPEASPAQKIEQRAGLTDFVLEYSRPAVRNRKIYGDLVPYGKLWRTGANQNTKLSFNQDIRIENTNLKAGTYSIFTKPGADTWTVYFYKDAANWGLPEKWDDNKVAAKLEVKVQKIPVTIENFTMDFNSITEDSVTLNILWENTGIAIPIKLNTDSVVTESITKTMAGKPAANDYYAAAVYYHNTGKNAQQAKTWMDKSFEMIKEPAYYQWYQKALIDYRAGDEKAAVSSARKSMELAKKVGSDDYIALNQKILKEWGKN